MANSACLDQAMSTINPAHLALPHNDQQPASDVSMGPPYADQIPLPSDPIWITPASAHILQQQETHLPYTGWESLTPNGDLNYSSYGSSPADNTVEYQLMMQRFGHYNIGVAQGGLDTAGLSRTASFSSFHHHPLSPTTGYPSRRCNRGRLLADISSPGPETVYEDSDSHHSWTAADNVETWSAHLRERLSEFRRNKHRISIITSHLQTRQRRKVHSMANLLGLSHTSLGHGRQKRVLICKSELVRSRAQKIEKRWNPSRNNWASGLVDPRVVLFDLISPKLSTARLQECLSEVGLPLPIELTIDCFDPMKPGILQPVATAYAMFQNADDAAFVLLHLDGTKPNWNSVDAELECDYVHFPPGFDLSKQMLDNFTALPDGIRNERSRIQQGEALPNFSPATSAFYSDDSQEYSSSEIHTIDNSSVRHHHHRRGRSRNPSNESIYYLRDAGYISASSPLHSDHSTHSLTHCHKKRKRVPKISGGYSCTFQGCDRVFDRDGDRRKHEKNHAGDRKYVCEKCKKGFLFPKDLRRHMIVHSITSLPSENELEGRRDTEGVDEQARENMKRNKEMQALSSSPLLSEEQFKSFYGERPRDRRMNMILSSGE